LSIEKFETTVGLQLSVLCHRCSAWRTSCHCTHCMATVALSHVSS